MIDLPPPDDRLVRAAWAKSDRDGYQSFPLYAHLEDTAAVADQLFAAWFSESQLSHLAETFGSESTAHRLATWIAGAHDVGKSTAAFAIKVKPFRARLEDAGFAFPFPDPPPEDQRRYPHGYAGQLAVSEHLWAKMQGSRRAKGISPIAEIIGGHHGVFPQNEFVPVPYGIGEHASWKAARTALLTRADQLAEIDDETWRSIARCRVPETAQALLNGFLIACDWIASNEHLFPYALGESASTRARRALDTLGFGEHWRPQQVADTRDYYSERFNIGSPRPVQIDAVALVSGLKEPSLVLVEAPTGEGKTEIGFSCAEALAARFGAHGFGVFLPTRATTNAMFERVLSWIRSAASSQEPVSVSLAHAKAEFDKHYASLFERGEAQDMYDDEFDTRGDADAAVGNLWFRGRKQRSLADFTIGTIDQLLFMTLKAKHLALRHLGMSGKVVVVDEVHAADAFMRTYLLRALEWLGAYEVPVIALSATLPPAQRAELLAAYRRGAKQRRHWCPIAEQQEQQEQQEIDEQLLALSSRSGYPLITAVGADYHEQSTPQRSGRRTDYAIESVEEDSLIDAVLTEAEAGGCIAVVLDTVDRAQRVYEQLVARRTGEIALFHSRFTVESRNRREQELIDRLGRDDSRRPESMIVVATQVVESSLDVDFDLMFTDIAPMDLLLQRMGRVHRHERPAEKRPESMQAARIVLTGGAGLLHPHDPPSFDRGVERVYGDSLLLRTVTTLQAAFGRHGQNVIRVPEDVPDLISSTYAEDFEAPRDWEERLVAADAKRLDLEQDQRTRSRQFVIAPPGIGNISDWSRLAYSEASEEQIGAAQVRDADISLEVVLVQEIDGRCYSLPWLENGQNTQFVDLVAGIEPEIARAVAECTVSLPSWLTRGSNLERVLDDLERTGFEGWQQSPWLRGVLPLILDEDLVATVGNFRLRYEKDRGLLIDGRASA